MQVLLEEIKAGRLSWQETVPWWLKTRWAGQVISKRQAGTSYGLEDLALEMLIHSRYRNNLIIERLGGYLWFKPRFQSPGYQDTRLQRLMMDQVAIAEGGRTSLVRVKSASS